MSDGFLFLPASLKLLASIFSLLAVIWLCFARQATVETRSRLGLPFYAAGIVQWFLFGVHEGDRVLMITCGLQLACLTWLLRRHTRGVNA